MKSLAFESVQESSAGLRPSSAVASVEGRGEGLVSVRGFREADRGAWNSFVHGHPDGTFFHLAEWQDVLERAFSHRAYYLLAEHSGEVCGVLPLAQVKSRLFGNALISTPFCVYGGAIAQDESTCAALESAACDLARRLGVDYLELRHRRRRHLDWPCADLNVTFRRPISDDVETNMLAIPRKQRAMVRKGMKAGLRSEVDARADRYYAVYSESMRNLGTPVFSRKFVDVMLEAFGESCDIVTILKEQQPVASVLNFYFRDEVLPYYGGGVPEAREVAGSDFMYWEVMERARRKGCRIFDFGRSKLGTGSYDFKTHWGFEPEQLHYEYYLVRRRDMPKLNRMNPKFSLAIKLWRRMPVKLTQVIGPPLARYLT